MTLVLIIALLLVGTFFMFVAGLGVLRMPDVLLRMASTTKAVTLGAGCMLGAAALYFDDLGITTRALAAIVFLIVTAPVAAHMIARAAYVARAPLWEGMIVDELRGRYDAERGSLSSGLEEKPPGEPPGEPPAG